MFWLFFALAAATATACYRVVSRHLMKTHSPYGYALLINVFGTFLTLPLIWTDFSWASMPQTPWPWLLVIASTVLWSIIMVLAYMTMKHLPVSRREQISQVEVLFVLLLGVLFLHEALTALKLIGSLLVLSGAILASSGRTAIFAGWRSKGVLLTVFVAFLYSIVAIVDKAALNYFPTGLYTFMLYLFPALVLLAFLVRANLRAKTWHLLTHMRWYVLLGACLSVTSYYLGLRAYDLADASSVYPITKLATILAVGGGILFFPEERQRIPRKLASAALVVLGAILVAWGAL